MLRLQIVSDIHLEFHRDHGISFMESLDPSGVDVLVLAGDITVLRDFYWAQDTLSEFCALYKDVVYVQGNHEYYGTSIGTADQHLNAIELGLNNLHVLRDGQPKIIAGQRFIGGTLWFGRDKNNRIYGQQMNDFHIIEGFDPWVYEQNDAILAGLQTHLQADDIVVTHHLPSQLSVHPKFKMSSLNRFFVCPQDQLILARKPKMWIHGHSHTPVDYLIGPTRVYANPLGYPNEGENPDFYQRLSLDL